MGQIETFTAADFVPAGAQLGREPSPESDALLPETFPSVFDQLPDGIALARVVGRSAPLLYVNSAFEELTGYTREEALGKDCRYLQGSDRDQPELERLREAMAAALPVDVTVRNFRKDGSAFWNRVSLRPIPVGNEMFYLGILRDVSAARDAEIALDRAANIDSATGCLNRQSFISGVERCLPAHPGPALILKLDVVGFHDVNTSYGFEVGDALLLETGRRLTETGAALVARLGANEFALAFKLSDEASAHQIAASVLDALSPDFVVPGSNISLRFAIGYAIGEQGGNTTTLLRNAGTALRAAKSDPFSGPRLFRREDAETARHRVRMTRELKAAVKNNEFVYHFQPQVDLASGEWVGAEALLRWNHPLFGHQLPGRFIEAAERTGLLLDLTERGLATVATFARRVNEQRDPPVRFAFNVSAAELFHRDMAETLERVLQQTGAKPHWLTLEITESMLLDNTPHIVESLGRLRNLGVGLSVDDFGTGYSSLRLIETFPVTEIKIDRTFVTNLATSPSKAIIVRAIIDLGRTLGLAVVAEGVETEAQRAALAGMGCPIAQGYLFGPAVDGESLALASAGH